MWFNFINIFVIKIYINYFAEIKNTQFIWYKRKPFIFGVTYDDNVYIEKIIKPYLKDEMWKNINVLNMSEIFNNDEKKND